jgi:hypothetical protein
MSASSGLWYNHCSCCRYRLRSVRCATIEDVLSETHLLPWWHQCTGSTLRCRCRYHLQYSKLQYSPNVKEQYHQQTTTARAAQVDTHSVLKALTLWWRACLGCLHSAATGRCPRWPSSSSSGGGGSSSSGSSSAANGCEMLAHPQFHVQGKRTLAIAGQDAPSIEGCAPGLE